VIKIQHCGHIASGFCHVKCNTLPLKVKHGLFGFTSKGIPMDCILPLYLELNADELLLLACDAAVFTFQMLFPSKKVIPALNTIGVGARDGQGNIFLMKKFSD